MECETCGGTEFYKESGYFYCTECQIQSQEIREFVFQEDINNVHIRSTRKIKQAKQDKTENEITSWECYNIIICSLTEQLISLGASRTLKQIVKCLWMRYFEKLEVFHLECDMKPKLPLINSKRDAKILYGRTANKRRRKSLDESTASLNTSSARREQSKKKRALVQAHYEEFSQKSTQETVSLHNETLTSIKSTSDKSEKSGIAVTFNRYGIKELKKKVSARHYRQHKLDKDQNLKCHKLTYGECSRNYKLGVHVITPIKLYCILYLGLLINRDKIHLGDLFRFIREGHLSFNNYTHLFPEDYSSKFLNLLSNNTNFLFSNKFFRVTAAKMATFLNVVKYIGVVDIPDLCKRFCKEMNLPDELSSAVRNLVSKTKPKLKFTTESKIIPNYEGRAISFIIFTLKLLFGLDGVTEFKMSNYAQQVNNLKIKNENMFDIARWMEYISYRNIVISADHFPYLYEKSSDEVNSNIFLEYINLKNLKPFENAKLSKEMTDYEELLLKIKDLQYDEYLHLECPPSLTPFLDYSKVLSNSTQHFESILEDNFQGQCLTFLLRPYKYIDLLSDCVVIKHAGANDNWVIEDIQSRRTVKDENRRNHKLIPIEVITNGLEKGIDEVLGDSYNQLKTSKKKYDPQHVQRNYQECRQKIFEENDRYLKKISKRDYLEDISLNVENSKSYKIHFNPYERYWLYLQLSIHCITKKESESFFNKFSNSFRLIFNECARITEQTCQELLYEFQLSELFLIFVSTYGEQNKNPKSNKLLDTTLRYYVRQAEVHW